MLRPIKVDHYAPRVMGYRILDTSGTPSVNDGCKDDVSSVTDNGAGDSTINFIEPFKRAPIAIVTPEGASGAIGNVHTVAAGSVRTVLNSSTGSGTDGQGQVMVFGFDHPLTQKSFGPEVLKNTRISPVLIGLSVDSDGTMLGGKRRASCSLNGSTFTITLTNPFSTTPIVVGTVRGSTAGVVRVTSRAANQIVINTYDPDGSGSALGFDLFVLGFYNPQYGGKRRRIVHCPQKLPRLLVYEITVTAGAPSLTLGDVDGTVADTGTGHFTITYTKAFKRAPQVVASADGSSIVTGAASSTTALQVKAFTNAGVAGDPGKVYVAALGYDHADEV